MKFYSSTWPFYLTDLLNLRFVGARINVSTWYSQQAPAVTWIQTQDLTLRLLAQRSTTELSRYQEPRISRLLAQRSTTELSRYQEPRFSQLLAQRSTTELSRYQEPRISRLLAQRSTTELSRYQEPRLSRLLVQRSTIELPRHREPRFSRLIAQRSTTEPSYFPIELSSDQSMCHQIFCKPLAQLKCYDIHALLFHFRKSL